MSPSLSHLFAQHDKDLKPSSPASPRGSIAGITGGASAAEPGLRGPDSACPSAGWGRAGSMAAGAGQWEPQACVLV